MQSIRLEHDNLSTDLGLVPTKRAAEEVLLKPESKVSCAAAVKDALKTTSNSADTEASSTAFFALLPDESLMEIGEWLPSARDLSYFATATCQRFRRVLHEPSTEQASPTSMLHKETGSEDKPNEVPISTPNNSTKKSPLLIRILEHQRREKYQGFADQIRTWEQLALYEAMEDHGLLQENRIGFSMASTEIREDDEEDDETYERLIPRQNFARLAGIRKILSRFPTSELVIDAHCGTLAPWGISIRFSKVRGITVAEELLQDDEATASQDDASSTNSARRPINLDQNRMILRAWGKRVTTIAAACDPKSPSYHRFCALADLGIGWVELYVVIDGLEL